MDIILEDVARLDRLITDISDASRLDAELAREQGETVDAGRLLANIVESYGLLAAAEGAEGIVTRGRVALERDSAALTVTGHEGRLAQVFQNLIDNALSFSPPGGTVTVAARRRRGEVEITVSDQGPGLPPGTYEKVFERFYSERPDFAKKKEGAGQHSGLGLAISKQIVEGHGGRIFAANASDPVSGGVAGAVFTVVLPARG
jgi:two-component system sensor histidine kinase ChvG